MSHFLEHLNSFNQAKDVIESATKNAKEFVYIQQPFFDADGYLFSQELMFYWSFWRGHKNHMTSIEFHEILMQMLNTGAISRYGIYFFRRIVSSQSEKIHSFYSVIDSQNWDTKIHPPKKDMNFSDDIDIFQEIRVLISVSGDVEWGNLEKSFKWDKKVFDSNNI